MRNATSFLHPGKLGFSKFWTTLCIQKQSSTISYTENRTRDLKVQCCGLFKSAFVRNKKVKFKSNAPPEGSIQISFHFEIDTTLKISDGKR